jgi:SAM-dependent methyltransferase
MATSTAVKTEQPGQIDLSALKTKQHGAWSSGDYAIVGTTLQIVGEELCEALDLRAGQKVLDVAAGNGNATLAAARRWCEVVSTDYVPSLLERGRARAAAEGLSVQFKEADAEALDFSDATFDTVLSTFGVMFTPDQDRAASELLRVWRQDRSRQLDAGRFYRAAVQDARQIPAAAGRREIARTVGHAGAHHGDVRNIGSLDQGREASLHVPLPLADALSRRVQELLWPDAESLCRT